MYAPTVMEKVPRFWWFLAGASLLVGGLLSAAYWRRPGKAVGVALLVAQLVVLLSNAIARQIVQFHDLQKWVDLQSIPVRGEWGSFFLFIITFVVALGVIIWIAMTTLYRRRSTS